MEREEERENFGEQTKGRGKEEKSFSKVSFFKMEERGRDEKKRTAATTRTMTHNTEQQQE